VGGQFGPFCTRFQNRISLARSRPVIDPVALTIVKTLPALFFLINTDNGKKPASKFAFIQD
jgi:hypothetical protein